jgi:hypothetical protein
MSPPIPLVILFDWRMEFFCVSLSPRILILKSIGGQIIFNSNWFLKDEEAIDWRGGFRSFHWTRGTSSRNGHGRLTKCVDGVCFLKPREQRRKEENKCVREELVLICEKTLFMKKMRVQTKSMEGSCV